MLSLDQLLVLETIERTGSFTAAAVELHRATSAVSYAIKTLESELDLELFDRSGHRASLTAAGRIVLDGAREVLEHARSLERTAKVLRNVWEPRLSVVLDGLLPMRPVVSTMQRFIELSAPTRVELTVDYLEGVEEQFEEREADLMIALDPRPDPHRSARPLAPVEMVLVVGRTHPLSRLKRPVRRADLRKHVELVVAAPSRHTGRAPPLALGSTQLMQWPDFPSKLEALLAGLGYGWLPRHLSAAALEAGSLRLLGFEEGDSHLFTPQLVSRAHVAQGRAASLFARYLVEALGC